MKKVIVIGMILLLGASFPAFAKAGNAYDGLEFILAIIGFLLLVAGMLEGIDYLKKNGKRLFSRVVAFGKKKITTLKEHFRHGIRHYVEMQLFS